MSELPLTRAGRAADQAREWTERRDRAIRKAVAGGKSLREVAAATGLTHSGIAKIVKR